MASAGDLLTLYLGLELATLSLYVLVVLRQGPARARARPGLKYIILGAAASAIYIYGVSLIYGSAGTTLFAALLQDMGRFGGTCTPGMLVGGVMVLAALAFKVAAVPFHMWAPDVYQGAPTPVTAFLSTASKAAGFAALIRVFSGPIGASGPSWVPLVMLLAGLSMVVGNLLAIPQREHQANARLLRHRPGRLRAGRPGRGQPARPGDAGDHLLPLPVPVHQPRRVPDRQPASARPAATTRSRATTA